MLRWALLVLVWFFIYFIMRIIRIHYNILGPVCQVINWEKQLTCVIRYDNIASNKTMYFKTYQKRAISIMKKIKLVRLALALFAILLFVLFLNKIISFFSLVPMLTVLLYIVVVLLKIRNKIKKLIFILPSFIFIVTFIITIWYNLFNELLPFLPDRMVFIYVTCIGAEISIIALLIGYIYFRIIKKEKEKISTNI